ncbi:MAG: outer membrane protein assembly factor BamB [Chromatiales bacterium]|jgi:outer membrane protein assembly factor BamB
MKRRTLVFLAALALGGCGSLNPLDWATRGEDVVPPAELVEIPNAVPLSIIWSADVGSGTDERWLHLVPFVHRGRVYTADAEGHVEARDATNGALVWSVEAGEPVSGGPGGGEDLVVVGTADGEVLAADADTGAERWRARVTSEVLSSPTAALGVVLVHSQDGNLTALDARTGSRLWVTRREVPQLSLRGSSSPVVSGTTAICGFADGKVLGLDLTTGLVRWEANAGIPRGRSALERLADVDADPLVIDGVVYLATFQGDVVALSEQTGIVLWRRELSSHAGMAGDFSQLYVTGEDDHVWALQQRNGAALWRQRNLDHRRLTAPAVLGDYVLVGDFEGYVHLLSREDGSLVGRTRVGEGPITVAPVVADGIVYVLGDEGDLAALRLPASKG